jgi:hypothetical protein
MIADQWTGKYSGPALVEYLHGASAIPLFFIFRPIFENILKIINYQIMGVDTNTDTDTEE